MSVLGERIKKLRKEKGLNQTQLAQSLNREFGLNIDRAMVSKWETDFQTPVINTIKCMAKFFDVTIDYLNGNEYSLNPDLANIDSGPHVNRITVYAMNGEKSVDSIEVNEDNIEEIAELVSIANQLPKEKVQALINTANAMK